MREFGSEFDYVGDDGAIQSIWNGFSTFKLLRCGRDAVSGTAIAMLKERGIKTVWVPALSCISMYGGLCRREGRIWRGAARTDKW